MRRLLLATVCILGFCTQVRADLPVIDGANLGEWAQQLQKDAQTIENQVQQIQQLETQISQFKNMITDIEDVPAGLASQVTSLIGTLTQNPLGDITSNLHNLMFSQGTGSCSGASSILSLSSFHTSVGSDFNGTAILNGTANRLSGFMSCTDTLMQSSQRHLAALPDLLNQLQACKDDTCVNAVNGRIMVEIANLQALHEQATLLTSQASIQQQMQELQQQQKQRADAEENMNATDAWDTSSSTSLVATNNAPLFNASDNQP